MTVGLVIRAESASPAESRAWSLGPGVAVVKCKMCGWCKYGGGGGLATITTGLGIKGLGITAAHGDTGSEQCQRGCENRV